MKNSVLTGKTFVCGIGAQKCGTSFISDYLSAHPECKITPLKELHYFDSRHVADLTSFEKKLKQRATKFLRRLGNGNEVDTEKLFAMIRRIDAGNKHDIASYFEAYVKPEHKVFGEITPSYALLPKNGFEEILNTFPDSRFIYMLRNPVDRLWSQASYRAHLLRDSVEATSVIEEILQKVRSNRRSNYTKTLEQLFSVVDRKKVFVGFYEDLFGDKHQKTIEGLSAFLGISYQPDIQSVREKVNPTSYKSALNESTRTQLVNELRSVYEYVYRRYEIPQAWREDIARLK